MHVGRRGACVRKSINDHENSMTSVCLLYLKGIDECWLLTPVILIHIVCVRVRVCERAVVFSG